MENCSEEPIIQKQGGLTTVLRLNTRQRKDRWIPCRGLIICIAIHQSELEKYFKQDRIVLSVDSAIKTNQWYGFVVGVGAGVDCVEEGDIIQLSRWVSTEWHSYPGRSIMGDFNYSDDSVYTVQCVDNPHRSIEVSTKNAWVWLKPEHVLFRVFDYDGNTNSYVPGVQPVADRILVKRIRRIEATDGGIYMPEYFRHSEWSPMGEVVDVGDDIEYDDLIPGDWVLVPEKTGTHITFTDKKTGEVSMYTLLRIGDVELMMDEEVKPAYPEKFEYKKAINDAG